MGQFLENIEKGIIGQTHILDDAPQVVLEVGDEPVTTFVAEEVVEEKPKSKPKKTDKK